MDSNEVIVLTELNDDYVICLCKKVHYWTKILQPIGVYSGILLESFKMLPVIVTASKDMSNFDSLI